MRVVTYEPYVHATVQGEGVLVGTPSVFLRLHGCDYACSWCDSKRSWQPSSTFLEVDIPTVIAKVRGLGGTHLVVTGGNPVLQSAELVDVLAALHGAQADGSDGYHITLETQGSVFDQALLYHTDLISLSPKIHDWPSEALAQWLQEATLLNVAIQVKIVITSKEDVFFALDKMYSVASWLRKTSGGEAKLQSGHVTFLLQPEFGLGRQGVGVAIKGHEEWRQTHRDCRPPIVRVLPQVHKTSLFVR